jgi:hypothetical protein
MIIDEAYPPSLLHNQRNGAGLPWLPYAWIFTYLLHAPSYMYLNSLLFQSVTSKTK